MNNKILPIFIIVLIAYISGCAKKDLVIDMGHGDSIRLVGAADNFNCDDPAYAKVDKVVTWTMQFADGSSKNLCAPKESASKSNVEPPIPASAMKPEIIQSGEWTTASPRIIK